MMNDGGKCSVIARRIVADANSNDIPYSFVMECFEKHAEVDDYEHGILPDAESANFGMNITVKGKTLRECVNKACDAIGADHPQSDDDIFITDDTISISRTENDDAEEPAPQEVEDWKKGKARLWLCDYYWSVKMIVDKTLDEEFLREEFNRQ